MKYVTQVFAIVLVALIGFANEPALAQQRSPDRVALDQLAGSGSDLSKLHNVDFYLHFPTQEAAERAAVKLVALAFVNRTEPGKKAGDWVVVASKRMFPVESDLSQLRDKLNVIAAAEGGVYERWQARVIE